MKTTIEKITELESYVFKSPISSHLPCDYLGIEKISLDDDFTRIDFVYIAPIKYINGGWIQMNSSCYITRSSSFSSGIRYQLIKAINIPIAPTKYCFRNSGVVHHYTLLFPPLPKNVKKIDIVEKKGAENYFNFYGVVLSHKEPIFRIINEKLRK